jgi:hypothetical protein
MKRCVLILGLCPMALQAKTLHVLIGPPSIGQGGSNPVSVPPANPVDWQFTYVTDQNREWLVSLVPGLLWGQRFYQGGFYAALGGGLLVTSSGLGVGVDHAYGYESRLFLKHFRYQVEYRQVIGVGNYGWQFPYTFRMGLSYAL